MGALLLVATLWSTVAACDLRFDVDVVVVACDANSPQCPATLVCIIAAGRCLPGDSPCVADDGVSPIPDGVACTTADGVAGVCAAALCAESRCGDGRVDVVAGEVCDDGAANRVGWGPEAGCLGDCSGGAPTCGDGDVAAEEVCDDGARDACGSCNSDCLGFGSGSVCGDGVVCPEFERCDDAGESVACNADCTVASCGDGVVNGVLGEACDDGAANNSDDYGVTVGCNATCSGQVRACGDLILDPEEVCDDPVQSTTCERTCQPPVCGDGVTNTLVGEACDTGGSSPTCTDDCQPRKSLSVGFGHTCVINDGEAFCFGSNDNGQCGDNPAVVGAPLDTMGGNLRPLPIDGEVDGVVAGLRFTCANTSDGRVACFGENQLGQTGSGDPFVDTGGPVTDLAAGRSHVCALREDGSVVCWGENRVCQAGAGHARETVGTTAADMGSALVPVSLQPGRVTTIGAGEFFTCALFDNGRVQCWGAAADGALGLGDTVDRGCAPGEPATMPFVDLPGAVASMSVGGRHVCALLTNRNVVCWGFNGSGALGQGITAGPAQADFRRGSGPLQMGVFIPATPLGATNVVRLTASGTGGHTCALLEDGGLKCWGDNGQGELGLGDRRDRGGDLGDLGDALPRVDLGAGVVAVDASAGKSSCARIIRNGGGSALKCWGSHTSGGAVGTDVGGGLGRPLAFPIGDGPGEMGGALPEVPLTAGCGNGIAEEGEACDDGFNDACGSCNADCSAIGEGAVCGDGRRCLELEGCDPGQDPDCTPTCVPCGGGRCIERCPADVCGDGLVCEGREVCDPAGVAGDDCEATCDARQPSLHTGLEAACHLDGAGVVRCFGSLREEQLGRPALLNVADARDALPVDLGSSRRVQQLSKSPYGRSTCAVLSDERVVCWGDNTSGQLGTGDLINRGDNPALMGNVIPTVNLGNFPVDAVAVGGAHVCALSTAGLVKCWGNNGNGRLGQGLVVDRIGQSPAELGDALPPIRLGTGVVAVAISAGLEHSCGVDTVGAVRCWGRGQDGRLGSGDDINIGDDALALSAGIPSVDLGTTDGVTTRRALKVVAGRANSCALVEPRGAGDQELVCWGASFVGQLGIGRPSAATPIGDSPDELGDALVAVDFGGPVPIDVCLGFTHACALLDGGAVRCWGSNTNGRLGFAREAGSPQATGIIGDDPDEVAAFPDVPLAGPADAITCSDSSACARLTDGRFSCWGEVRNGALGLGEQTLAVGTADEPLPVLALP